jgi:hypothetical protein
VVQLAVVVRVPELVLDSVGAMLLVSEGVVLPDREDVDSEILST